jgi:hypothetical protein
MRAWDTSGLGFIADHRQDPIIVFVCEQPSNITRGKHIVEIHKPLVITNVGVSKKEGNWNVLNTSLLVEVLQINP